jgi:hypothetical protein
MNGPAFAAGYGAPIAILPVFQLRTNRSRPGGGPYFRQIPLRNWRPVPK